MIERSADGLVISMMTQSLAVTPMAALSRMAAGIRGCTVIVNFPGSRKGSQECLEFIAALLPHAVDLLNDKVNLTEFCTCMARETSAQLLPFF